jgi:hypothetical protein
MPASSTPQLVSPSFAWATVGLATARASWASGATKREPVDGIVPPVTTCPRVFSSITAPRWKLSRNCEAVNSDDMASCRSCAIASNAEVHSELVIT